MITVVKKLLQAGDEEQIENVLKDIEREAFMDGYYYAITVLKQNIVKNEEPSS